MASALKKQNEQYPFDFTKSPLSLRASLSLPIFDGLGREARLEAAQANRADIRYSVRSRELSLGADVTAAYLSLRTAYRTVQLQEQNARKAREELTLAEERYRVGAAIFLDVSTARVSYERAESDRINAIYDYHKAYAVLESAVGRPLR
jgi:outer membrane protein